MLFRSSRPLPIVEFVRAAREAVRGPQRKPTLVLLSSTVLMLVWWHFGSPQFLARWFATARDDGRAAGAVGSFLACFVLLGVIPAMMVRLVFGERLADYGVGWGVPGRTRWSVATHAPLFLVAAYAASCDPAIVAKFPINPRAGDSATIFALHAATYVFFHFGWEFHFRGFLLCGLRPSIGDTGAILVATMASALLHLGGPAAETFGAVPAGIFWGAIALWTRSLVPGIAQHFLLGVALDAFICFL